MASTTTVGTSTLDFTAAIASSSSSSDKVSTLAGARDSALRSLSRQFLQELLGVVVLDAELRCPSHRESEVQLPDVGVDPVLGLPSSSSSRRIASLTGAGVSAMLRELREATADAYGALRTRWRGRRSGLATADACRARGRNQAGSQRGADGGRSRARRVVRRVISR
eukprot:6414828-Pyramimonas_sp.AAC.1